MDDYLTKGVRHKLYLTMKKKKVEPILVIFFFHKHLKRKLWLKKKKKKKYRYKLNSLLPSQFPTYSSCTPTVQSTASRYLFFFFFITYIWTRNNTNIFFIFEHITYVRTYSNLRCQSHFWHFLLSNYSVQLTVSESLVWLLDFNAFSVLETYVAINSYTDLQVKFIL